MTSSVRLVQALAVEAERRGFRVRVADERTERYRSRRAGQDPHLLIDAEGHECGIRFAQLSDRSEHVPTAKELADAERYSWVRIPKYDYTPGASLSLSMDGPFEHRGSSWIDRVDRPLEDQLPEVLQEVELRSATAKRRRLADEEAARDKRRRWEAAMAAAREDYAESFRVKVLERQERNWRRTRELSEYLRAARERVEALPAGERRDAAEVWLDWIQQYTDRLNPLDGVLRMPDVPEPRSQDLEPFLNGWSPYGPGI
ncbi:MAG: hypothetical protein ACRDPT_03100 [Streptomycetales bacterium]